MTIERPIPPVDQTRRRFITVAAGASVASVGTLAVAAMPTTEPGTYACAVDPIYAAINAHITANGAHWAAIKASEGLTDWSITEKPCHDENDAFDCLVRAAATTLAGLCAKLTYLRAIADSGEAWMLDEREGTSLRLIDSFTASLKNVGVQS